MKIKRLYINNYKSLVDFELIEPNPFSVFVGPNAAGKSNVFEALEFLSYDFSNPQFISNLFGSPKSILNKQIITLKEKGEKSSEITLEINYQELTLRRHFSCTEVGDLWGVTDRSSSNYSKDKEKNVHEFPHGYFSRVFVKKVELVRFKTNGSDKLRIDANNLEAVLHRILQDEIKREEITEWLELLIPEFSKIEVAKSELSGDYYLRIFEKYMDEPIGKNLISDGTYNILALLTAVYQSDEPQFLCIEEPENGLTPFVIYEMVNLFRQMCEEKGHYIWLNTHSPYLVRQLQPKEIILIDKKEGITRAKQVDKDLNFKTMKMDEAWLSNALGGGLPW